MKFSGKLILKSLTIKNFATIENQTINFDNGFNAIVGETGSGKSLVLDALQLIFGQRADKKIIRKSFEYAIIEASFNVTSDYLKDYFFELGHPFDNDEIVIKRVIYKECPSKSFLNYSNCSLATLNSFANGFIDIVGQFENQKLLNDNYQLSLLDSYSKLSGTLLNYQKDFSLFHNAQNKIFSKLKELEKLKQKEDYTLFQIKEIETLSPSEEDETLLIEKKNHLLKYDKFKNLATKVVDLLSENETKNVLTSLQSAINLINDHELSNRENLSGKLHEALSTVEEVSFELSSTFSSEENVEDELQDVLDKLDSYQKLKRKFGSTTREVTEQYKKFICEIESIKNLETEITNLEIEKKKLQKSSLKKALELHKLREINSIKLSKSLTSMVRELKMEGATIEVKLTQTPELTKNGVTKLSLRAETNPGEGLFKIKDIASGGELSRILLAFRQSLSANDSISIFLFDEIDSGIGGETALAVGKALKNVSKDSQVLTITHLPQIANFADKLIHVSKKITNPYKGRSKTESIITEIKNSKKSSFIQNMTPL